SICWGRTREGPAPKRPSAGLRLSGMTMSAGVLVSVLTRASLCDGLRGRGLGDFFWNSTGRAFNQQVECVVEDPAAQAPRDAVLARTAAGPPHGAHIRWRVEDTLENCDHTRARRGGDDGARRPRRLCGHRWP